MTIGRKSKKKYRGKPIWTVDAETDPFKKGRVPAPFIWGCYTGEEYFQFEKTDDLISFLFDKEVIVYAHNGGKFDWHFITDYIEDYEPLTIINGRLAKFKIGECEFRDSYNIIPAPLSAYKKDEISYDLFEIVHRKKPENWAKICDYLKSDCVYLHEMVSQFIEDYGMNLTQASAAMTVWSKMTDTPKPKSTDGYYDDFKKYYYGGRVECFKKGIIENDFSVVDINSAYPYAMTFEHPWGGNFDTDISLDGLDDDDISRSFITLEADALGAFPFRSKNGLIFPNDGLRYTFYVSGWEYLAARDTGCLKNEIVKEVTTFHDQINFKEYVDYFFELKDTADKKMKEAIAKGNAKETAYWATQRLFAKLFLNSLYGKFASNPENYEEFMTLPAEFIDAANQVDGWTICKLISEETVVVCRPLEDEKRRYYDVAVSASITGFVRAFLWRNICSTKGTALYCDTDSIAASDVSSIILSNKLGDWELEAQCNFAAIGGKKLYAFRKIDGKYKTASKGVRLEPEEIIEIAEGGTVTYEPEAPTFSIKGGVRFTPRTIRMTE